MWLDKSKIGHCRPLTSSTKPESERRGVMLWQRYTDNSLGQIIDCDNKY